MMEYQIKQFRDSSYYVSTTGEVFSKFSKGLRKLKPWICKGNGYWMVATVIGDERKKRTVHRMMAEAFFGPSTLAVNHKNGERGDNRIENIEYCTFKENSRHAVDVLGKGRGETHSQARLTEPDVLAIRSCGLTLKQIALQYGISESHASSVRRGIFWSHLNKPAEAESN
jgi:hypothetical protein